MDGLNETMQLPVKQRKDICVLMSKIKKIRVALNELQKLAGKLQHASIGIPGGRILFTPIDMYISGNPDVLSITPTLRQCLEYWR